MTPKTIPIFLVFLAMGFTDAVGPFVGLAKGEFRLSTAAASLIPFAGLSMFGLLSIPAGILQHRTGKKFVLLLGLAVIAAGLLNASFGLSSFLHFLLTIVLLGAGAAVLQVAGNPVMRDVSEKGKYARNLVLGQFIKAIGSLSGAVIPVVAARYFGASWSIIFPIYAAAIVIAIIAVAALKLPVESIRANAVTARSCFALLRNPFVFAMTAAIFLYVGAEVCVSAAIPLFLKEQFDVDITRVGLLGTGLFFTTLTIGRFCGGIILNWISPTRFLALSCGVSLLGLLGVFLPNQRLALACFALVGLGFANIFPLLFSTTIEKMPQHADEISGLMVTAIVGGALLPPLMGLLADHTSVRLGFSVPLLAIVYVAAAAGIGNSSRGSHPSELVA